MKDNRASDHDLCNVNEKENTTTVHPQRELKKNKSYNGGSDRGLYNVKQELIKR